MWVTLLFYFYFSYVCLFSSYFYFIVNVDQLECEVYNEDDVHFQRHTDLGTYSDWK